MKRVHRHVEKKKLIHQYTLQIKKTLANILHTKRRNVNTIFYKVAFMRNLYKTSIRVLFYIKHSVFDLVPLD